MSIFTPASDFCQIRSLDDPEIVVSGQFPIESVSETRGSNLVSQDRFGFQNPLLQWTGGKRNELSFTLEFFSEHPGDTQAREEVDRLISLSEKDENLGRPHVCSFEYGKIYYPRVLINDLSVTYKSFFNTGEHRQISVAVNLIRYQIFSDTISSLGKSLPSSKSTLVKPEVKKKTKTVAVTREDQSYENLAKKHLKDPSKGELIRRENPKQAFNAKLSETVTLPNTPEGGSLENVEVEPRSPIFLPTSKSNESYRKILEERGLQKRVIKN